VFPMSLQPVSTRSAALHRAVGDGFCNVFVHRLA